MRGWEAARFGRDRGTRSSRRDGPEGEQSELYRISKAMEKSEPSLGLQEPGVCCCSQMSVNCASMYLRTITGKMLSAQGAGSVFAWESPNRAPAGAGIARDYWGGGWVLHDHAEYIYFILLISIFACPSRGAQQP